MGNQKSNGKQQERDIKPFYDLWKDEYRSVLLLAAHGYDEGSVFNNLPKEIVGAIVVLEQHERRMLSRSHYRICMIMAMPPDLDWRSLRSIPTSYNPYDFSVALVPAASKVIDFLLKVKRISEFNKLSFATTQLGQYLKFLTLQNDSDEELVPSLEIQAVWFSHMLQSCPYRLFMDTNFPRVVRWNHPIVRGLDAKKETELQARTAKLMEEMSWISQSLTLAKWSDLVTHFTPDMVIYDRDWIVEFLKFTYATDVHSLAFLEKAHLGYQKFMHLKAGECNERVESIGFSPCPSIDLIWHTHLLHPIDYDRDMRSYVGHTPKHKLLALTDRTKIFMESRDDASLSLWHEVFQESLFDYATA